MIQIKRILVPVDFSEFSAKAVTYGLELARKFGAQLQLLHVVELVPIVFHEGAVYSTSDLAELIKAAEVELAKVAHGETVDIVRHTVDGHPLVQILRHAKEHEVDLIVIGTHGRTGLAHLFLGSVAENVVRKAPCPVLTVHNPEHEFVLP